MSFSASSKAPVPSWYRGFCASVLLAILACGSKSESPPLSRDHEAAPPEGITEIEWGEWLFSSYGCAACHSVANVDGIGPPLNNIAGTERTLADGTRALADSSYLRTALLDPAEHIPAGYEERMPEYELSYPQVDALVAYLNHLGGVVLADDE